MKVLIAGKDPSVPSIVYDVESGRREDGLKGTSVRKNGERYILSEVELIRG